LAAPDTPNHQGDWVVCALAVKDANIINKQVINLDAILFMGNMMFDLMVFC
jgi:hypothetical protein